MIFFVIFLAFFSPSTALTINCTFTMRYYSQPNDSYIYLPNSYACISYRIAGIEDSENITAIYGNHQSGKTNDDVLLLEIYSVPNLKFVPRGIEQFFPNIFAFNFMDCDISELRGDELQPLHNISWIRFENNPNLVRIPGNLLENKSNMTVVCFINNGVKHVDVNFLNSLASLPHLVHTDFRENSCIDQFARNATTELTALIENLRENCEDIEFPPSCDDFNAVICYVQKQNQKLVDQNEEILNDVDILTTKNIQLSTKVDELTLKNSNLTLKVDNLTVNVNELTNINQNMTLSIQELTAKNVVLNEAIDALAEENAEIKLMLTEVLEKLNDCI